MEREGITVELFLLGEKEKKKFDRSLWSAFGCFSREWCNL